MRRPSLTGGILLLSISVIVAACRTSEAATYVSRDSAGVRIVESSGPSWGEGDAWTITAEPEVSIGGPDADSAYSLHQVWHTHRLRDGRLAVVNSSTDEVRIFSARGEHIRTVGRSGQGPGELGAAWWVTSLPGDSLLVLDIGRGFRFSVFDTTGAHVRTFGTPVASAAEGTELIDRFSDGSILVLRHEFTPREEPAGVPVRNYVSFFRLGAEGAVLDSIGRFPNQTGMRGGLYLWGPWAQEAVHDTTFFFGSGDRWEVEHRARDGRLLRLIRLARANRSASAEDFEAWKAARLSSLEGRDPRRARELARRYDAARFASTLPAHFALKADADGNLWVQEYSTQLIGAGRVWSVFDTAGVFLGDVTMPDRLRVQEIGADYVLGVWTDPDDVEHVRLYRIVKPSST